MLKLCHRKSLKIKAKGFSLMEIFTIGYTKKSAKRFFDSIKTNRIDVLIDIRLYNSSQLAGFSKSRDLQYFLEQICGCNYVWAPQFAPTAELLNNYKNVSITWIEYEKVYDELLRIRDNLDFFEGFFGKRICLLCAEETPYQCHRRLLAEKIKGTYKDVFLKHL